MPRRYFKKRGEEQQAALDRIKILFSLASQEFKKYPERSHRYAKMINDLIKKVRVRPNKNIRNFICKECGHFLMPGKNLSIKSDQEFMIYTCLDCGNIKKLGYGREKRDNK